MAEIEYFVHTVAFLDYRFKKEKIKCEKINDANKQILVIGKDEIAFSKIIKIIF